jgi:catechol-2,3-dioxygenase
MLCGAFERRASSWTRASDHGVSEALYLRDPDDNGLELYWDRPASEWPRTPDGALNMFTQRLDLAKLLSEPIAASLTALWVASVFLST